jgi:hypothetical protein
MGTTLRHGSWFRRTYRDRSGHPGRVSASADFWQPLVRGLGPASRELVSRDLKAILLVLFTAMFITLMAGAQLSRARGTISAILAGWGAYIFAAALAALLTAFILADASLGSATIAAAGGATYALIVGWIVGIASMAGRRP